MGYILYAIPYTIILKCNTLLFIYNARFAILVWFLTEFCLSMIHFANWDQFLFDSPHLLQFSKQFLSKTGKKKYSGTRVGMQSRLGPQTWPHL